VAMRAKLAFAAVALVAAAAPAAGSGNAVVTRVWLPSVELTLREQPPFAFRADSPADLV
jgi:hypothetical protein